MGGASSREPSFVISPPIPSQSQASAVTRYLTHSSSFPIVVHHPPLHPGDSTHLVSLTSTTYNSPLSLLRPQFQETHMDSPKKSPQFLSRSFTYHHNSSKPASTKPLWRHLADDAIKPASKSSAAAGPTVVLYTTSLRGIRRTHGDCCAVRSILRGFRVAVDERDVSMDAAYRRELQALLGKARPFSLPQLLVGGRHVGGAEEVRQLHEGGELGRVLEGASRVVDPAFVCGGCGGVRFVPCGGCSGSRKVFVEEEGRMRRCDECNENGLVRCPNCSSTSPF